MRPGCVKVETKGSLWWFDETTLEYLRLPKNEQPRERPEWGGPEAGALQDAVWHPYKRWTIEDDIARLPNFAALTHPGGDPTDPDNWEVVVVGSRLVIQTDDGRVTAPDAAIVTGTPSG